MGSTYQIAPDSTDHVLRLTMRPSSKWFIAGGLGLFGGMLLFGYIKPEMMTTGTSDAPLIYHGIGLLGLLLSLWALHTALDNPTITVDGRFEEIRFECKWWGIFPKTKRIPFREIEELQVRYYPKNDDREEYWAILVRKKGSGFLDTIDQGGPPLKDYIEDVVYRISEITDVSASHSEFSVEALRKRMEARRAERQDPS